MTRGKRIDVLIASSDAPTRTRFVALVQQAKIVGRVHEAADRKELERVVGGFRPAVLLLDRATRGFETLQTLRGLRALSPVTRTILLVASPDESEAILALKEGARGYCPLSAGPALVLRAIERVAGGEIWASRRVVLQLIEELTELYARRTRPESRLGLLTPREHDVSRLVSSGACNKEIAERLSISERTVKAHLTHIFQKLGVANRLQLGLYTIEAAAPPTTKVH